jgi:hypothetical protein
MAVAIRLQPLRLPLAVDDDSDAAVVGDPDDGACDAHHRELTIFLKMAIFVIKKMR